MSEKTLPTPKTPLERMADLTRRIIAVPKAEIPRKRKTVKRKRR